MTENDLIAEGEETPTLPTPPEVERSLLTKLKRLVPVAVGVVAFLFGIVYFAPLDSYAFLALRKIAAGGPQVEIGSLKLSALGSFKAESVKIPLAGDNDKQGILKIAEAEGKVGLLGALFGDKYDADANAIILSFSKGDFGLKIDSLDLHSALEQRKSGGTQMLLNGTLALTAESVQIIYKENKFLKEEIVIPFLKIVLKCRVEQGNIGIETGEALGRMMHAQIRGSIKLGQPTDLNLNVHLKPSNEFFEKYQDKDPRTLLKFAGILHDDDHIEFNIRGSLNAPAVEAVKAKPQVSPQPNATTPAPSPK